MISHLYQVLPSEPGSMARGIEAWAVRCLQTYIPLHHPVLVVPGLTVSSFLVISSCTEVYLIFPHFFCPSAIARVVAIIYHSVELARDREESRIREGTQQDLSLFTHASHSPSTMSSHKVGLIRSTYCKYRHLGNLSSTTLCHRQFDEKLVELA